MKLIFKTFLFIAMPFLVAMEDPKGKKVEFSQDSPEIPVREYSNSPDKEIIATSLCHNEEPSPFEKRPAFSTYRLSSCEDKRPILASNFAEGFYLIARQESKKQSSLESHEHRQEYRPTNFSQKKDFLPFAIVTETIDNFCKGIIVEKVESQETPPDKHIVCDSPFSGLTILGTKSKSAISCCLLLGLNRFIYGDNQGGIYIYSVSSGSSRRGTDLEKIRPKRTMNTAVHNKKIVSLLPLLHHTRHFLSASEDGKLCTWSSTDMGPEQQRQLPDGYILNDLIQYKKNYIGLFNHNMIKSFRFKGNEIDFKKSKEISFKSKVLSLTLFNKFILAGTKKGSLYIYHAKAQEFLQPACAKIKICKAPIVKLVTNGKTIVAHDKNNSVHFMYENFQEPIAKTHSRRGSKRFKEVL